MQGHHEHVAREETVTPGSERGFAIVMAAAFALFATINWWYEGYAWPWLTGFVAILLTVGLYRPAALKPLNWLWFKFGLFLHAIVSPIAIGLTFFLAVCPVGLLRRAMGDDPLRLKLEPDQDSYWIVRSPPGPAAETMKDQF